MPRTVRTRFVACHSIHSTLIHLIIRDADRVTLRKSCHNCSNNALVYVYNDGAHENAVDTLTPRVPLVVFQYEQSILQRLQQLQAQQEAERRAAEAAKAEAARAKAEADRKAAQAPQAAAAAAAQAAAAASAAAASPSATGGGVATPSPTTKSPSTIGGFQATPSAGAAGATRALTTAAGSPPQSSSAAAAWDPRTIYAETLAYMKERREAFAQWNHARKSQIKRLCNSSSTKISASMRQVRAISQEFCNHIESARAEGDDTLLQWAFFCLAEKLCVRRYSLASHSFVVLLACSRVLRRFEVCRTKQSRWPTRSNTRSRSRWWRSNSALNILKSAKSCVDSTGHPLLHIVLFDAANPASPTVVVVVAIGHV